MQNKKASFYSKIDKNTLKREGEIIREYKKINKEIIL